MTTQQIIFIVCSAIVLGGALLVVTTRNLFHAALFLILSFFGVAGFYVLLEAGFFAVAQVLVYIGAISILIIFSVMLTRGMQAMIPRNSQAAIAAVVCGAVFVLMVLLYQRDSITIPGFGANGTARQIGAIPWAFAGEENNISGVPETWIAKFGFSLVDIQQYALPFLVSGILLELALIGAIHVARERRPAEIIAERAEIAAEEAAEAELPAQTPLPLPEVAPAHMESH